MHRMMLNKLNLTGQSKFFHILTQGFYTERQNSGSCIISKISKIGGKDAVIDTFNTDFNFGLVQLYASQHIHKY